MRFPIWHYLNQPVFSRHYRVILSPRRFWQSQQIFHLERCLSRAYKPEERLNP